MLLLLLLCVLRPCDALVEWPASGGSLTVGARNLEYMHHCTPRYVHLSPTGNDGSMRLTWQTSKRGCSSTVRYKRTSWWLDLLRHPGQLFRCTLLPCTAIGEEAVFDAQTDCYSMNNSTEVQGVGPDGDAGPVARHGIGWEPKIIIYRHTVVLDKLAAGRIKYQYVFESEKAHGHADEERRPRMFRSPPNNDPDGTLEFVVFGDMGAPSAEKCPGAFGTIKTLAEEATLGDTDVIFHNGDISYADGSPAIWDDFQGSIEPISSVVPYAVTVGNHDYGWLPGIGKKKHHHSQVVDASGLDKPYLPPWGNFGGDSNGECGYPLVNRFVMPQSRHSSVPSRAPFWYSVRMGPAHFVILSGEHDVSAGSEQRAWMDSEFEAINRSNTPWVVVLIHRPLYVVLPHKSNRIVGEHLAEMLEDTFIEQKVSLVVSGHVHSMSRSCPLLKGKCKKHGITYITMGSGGMFLSTQFLGGLALSRSLILAHRLYRSLARSLGKEISALDDPDEQPDWLANAQLVFGFGRFQIMNRTHMTFEYVESETGAGRVIDTVVVHNRALNKEF